MKLCSFVEFAGKLKGVERFKNQTYFEDFGIKRYESVADHTWRMILILSLITDKLSTSFNFEKVTKMIVIHDMPEIETGDLSPLGESGTGHDSHAFNPKKSEIKQKNETVVAARLFDSQPELQELWQEIEAQQSFEAKLVKVIDTYEGRLQSLEYLREAPYYAPEHLTFNLSYKVEIFDLDPYLKHMHNELLDEHKAIYETKPHTKPAV